MAKHDMVTNATIRVINPKAKKDSGFLGAWSLISVSSFIARGLLLTGTAELNQNGCPYRDEGIHER
jgi:hypothetical protein